MNQVGNWGTPLLPSLPIGMILVNLRMVFTLFQKEIIVWGIRFFATDEAKASLIKALVLSLYEKLNKERAEILSELKKTLRSYSV